MSDAWPDLARSGWSDTAETVKLWTQIIGKTRLGLEPAVNHWWHAPLYVTARGLATSVMHEGERAVEVELDLAGHALRVRDERGRTPAFPLEPMTVAAFDARFRAALAEVGFEPRIWPYPNEVVEAIRFDRDEVHRSYDATWAAALHAVLRRVDHLLKEFRGRFVGKVSPVHFFWGAFDLAVTRFSGRPAPRHPGGVPNCPDHVMVEAYSHELSSAGFWPGDARFPEAAFYAYAYPEPAGFAEATIRPAAARYEAGLGEFVLPYAAVRTSPDPRAAVLDFLQSTYEAAAELGRWDRAALERAGSLEPGEDWTRYPHDAFVERIEHFDGETVGRHLEPPRH